ncbi:hypothetical protein Tco_0336930 [Tanacetum coccineum]
MAASTIIISSDSSDESVGSPPSRVILFGDIPTVIPSTSVVAPETSTIAPVISSAAPMWLRRLLSLHLLDCNNTSISSYEFPIAPVTAPPGIHRRSAILIRPGEAIPFGRPYRTHLNGPRKLLTARKRVGPLPARRLASRHASPRSLDHHSSSSSSSSDSSPVHSLGLDASDQAHSGSLTKDLSPRLCYPPRRAPRRSEAFRRWCAAPLSTLYPPTTSESSSGDSSERPMHLSSHSAGPSRKRCRSPVDSVPLSTPVTGSLAPTRADLLPPRKRFRDSYSSEASIEEDAEVGPTETGVDMELGIGDGDDVGDHVEIDLRDSVDDTKEDGMLGQSGICRLKPLDEPSGDRARMAEMIYSLRLENLKVRAMLDIERDRVSILVIIYPIHIGGFVEIRRDREDARGRHLENNDKHSFGMTHAAIEEMINQRVNAALEAHRVNQNLELGNGNDNGNGNGNGNGNDNGMVMEMETMEATT